MTGVEGSSAFGLGGVRAGGRSDFSSPGLTLRVKAGAQQHDNGWGCDEATTALSLLSFAAAGPFPTHTPNLHQVPSLSGNTHDLLP